MLLSLKLGENLLKVIAPPNLKTEIGEKVWVTFDKNRIHLFDRNGKSII
jgi:ABC-type sugar transport system ATPase subunit